MNIDPGKRNAKRGGIEPLNILFHRPVRGAIVMALLASLLASSITAAIIYHDKTPPSGKEKKIAIEAPQGRNLALKNIEGFTVKTNGMTPSDYVITIKQNNKETKYRGQHPDSTPLTVKKDEVGRYIATYTSLESKPLTEPTIIGFTKYITGKVISIGRRIAQSEGRVFMAPQRTAPSRL